MGQLHDRMAQDMVLRRLRPATQRNYLLYCRKFAAFHQRSPLDMGQEEIRAFLLNCIQEQKLSHQTYRQIYAALKFLYSVTLKRLWEVEHIPHPRCPPRNLPLILTTEQVGRLLSGVIVLKTAGFDGVLCSRLATSHFRSFPWSPEDNQLFPSLSRTFTCRGMVDSS